MKKLGLLFIVISMMLFSLPLHAEGDSFDAYFTYVGRKESNEKYQAYDEYEGQTSTKGICWKNDSKIFKVAIDAHQDTNIQLSMTPLKDENKHHEIKDVDYGLLDKTSASLGVGAQEQYPHIEVSDIVTTKKEFQLHQGETSFVWIKVKTSRETKSGNYTSILTIQGDGDVQELEIQLEVLDLVLPKENVLSLDLWQYPHSSYRYYEYLQDKEEFSNEHLEVLKKELAPYASMQGSAITVSMIEEPWGHQSYDDTPSLITWVRANDGSIYFDYSKFDAWVECCMSVGIDQKIELFSILPFDPTITYTTESNEKIRYYVEVGSQEWKDIWHHFLEMLMFHLEEKGWLDISYVFIDERELSQVKEAVEVIQSTIVNDKTLKIATAINRIPEELELFDEIDSVSISVAAVPEDQNQLDSFIKHRKKLSLETTLYNCSTNYPNAFAISEPDESVWTMLFLYNRGFDGYLRWAYNAYVDNPNESLDFYNFEAGDTLLIYPGEKDSTPRPSFRLEMIEEGMKDVNKIQYLLDNYDNTKALQEALNDMRKGRGTFNAYGAMVAVNEEEKDYISQTVAEIEDILNQIAIDYLVQRPAKKYACP